jgi:SNF2 family DNA or RNA helicase/HJR/Mrr/RecB family endonuclease
MVNTIFRWEMEGDLVAFRLFEKRLLARDRPIPVSEWTKLASPNSLKGAAQIQSWIDGNEVAAGPESVSVEKIAISKVASGVAAALELPSFANLVLVVQHSGTVDQESFKLNVSWTRSSGQPVLGVQRTGAFVRFAGDTYRLPRHLFDLAEAIDAFQRSDRSDPDERLRNWAQLQNYLPDDAWEQLQLDGYVRTTRIAHAAAFSINFVTGSDGFDVDPVLFGPIVGGTPGARTSEDEEEPSELVSEAEQLLPPAYAAFFAKDRFRSSAECRPTYALRNGVYVFIDNDVREALNVVRKVQQSDRETRRQFVRNPRTYLRNYLQDKLDDEDLERLFVETSEYSARVRDVGLWEPRVIPWVQKSGDSWMPEKFGLTIGGKYVVVEPEELEPLKGLVSDAIQHQKPEVNWNDQRIPANTETLDALNTIAGIISPKGLDAEQGGEEDLDQVSEVPEKQQPLVLTIEDNFENVDYERAFSPRKERPSTEHPISVSTSLKQHQEEGFEWMKKAWFSGQPGVLLADDMGLGKTLLALTFLAWLRQGMVENTIRKAPILIVAPTGLLGNWEQEHDTHLSADGLGEPFPAYGRWLREIRKNPGREIDLGRSVLEASSIQDADWVLTTYETLRDYQHSFGAIRFSAIVFDEMQKVKTPGTMLTEAAKAMNGEFLIGLTGTPIENRLADMWCLVDTLEPGRLRDLSSFSQRYEKSEEPDRLRELKSILEDAEEHSAPIMLRRMKEDRLEGLPRREVFVREMIMPEIQAKAYEDVVLAARSGSGRGRMLEALQHMRSVSLHPVHPDNAEIESYISQSARLAITFDILDEIAERDEKALIFVESLDLQPLLASIIQRKYGLARQPMLISGAVTGQTRQKRVNDFQSSPKGFDVIILSPRAGGVGLTLTAANNVIHLSRWWNPAVEDQCTDRVYRIGQDKPVNVYFPQAIHPQFGDQSFDVRLHELLDRKRSLSREMLLPPVNKEEDTDALFRNTVGSASSDNRRSTSLEDIDTMLPLQFEDWILQRLKESGFSVNKTKKSWDAGADGVAVHTQSGTEVLLQCKHSQVGTNCDAGAVKEILNAREMYQKPAAKLVVVTNARSFTGSAQSLAESEGVILYGRDQLAVWPQGLVLLT